MSLQAAQNTIVDGNTKLQATLVDKHLDWNKTEEAPSMIDMGLERKQHFESEISHFLTQRRKMSPWWAASPTALFLHYRCIDFNYYKDDLFLSCEKQCIFVLFLFVVKKSFTKKLYCVFFIFQCQICWGLDSFSIKILQDILN